MTRQSRRVIAVAVLGANGFLGISARPARLDSSCEHEAARDSEHAPAGVAQDPVAHPDPRPGVTNEKLLTPEYVRERGRDSEAPFYAMARAIPHIIDGLYCYCHCAKLSGHRSLYTCYETGHAANCNRCMGEVEIAYELAKQGKTLDQIRAAIDAEYGDS